MSFGGYRPIKGVDLFPSVGTQYPVQVKVYGADPNTVAGAAAIREVSAAAQNYYIRAAHNFSLSTNTFQKTKTQLIGGDSLQVTFNGAFTQVVLGIAPRRGFVTTIETDVPAVWLFDARDFSDNPLEPGFSPQAIRAIGAVGTAKWVAAKYPWGPDGIGEVGVYGGYVAPDGIDAVSWNKDYYSNDTDPYSRPDAEGYIFSKGRQIADLTWAR